MMRRMKKEEYDEGSSTLPPYTWESTSPPRYAPCTRVIQDADVLRLPLAMARQLKGKARKQTKEEKRAAAARRLKAKEDFVKFYLPLISVLFVVLLVLFFYYY